MLPVALAELPDRPINIYKETETNKIAIKWKHETLEDLEEWFESRGIGLTWAYDLDDDGWTVYQAESVAVANGIMQAILDVLSGKPAAAGEMMLRLMGCFSISKPADTCCSVCVQL